MQIMKNFYHNDDYLSGISRER